jgi:hypothetical protein
MFSMHRFFFIHISSYSLKWVFRLEIREPVIFFVREIREPVHFYG